MGQGYRAAAYAQSVVFLLEPETIGGMEFYTHIEQGDSGIKVWRLQSWDIPQILRPG
jgi:hypothetical protein